MTTPLMRPSITIDVDGEKYSVRARSEIRLDAREVPYAQAEIELPLLEDAVLTWLDQAGDVRCPITAGDEAQMTTYIEDPGNPGFFIPRS